jgi:hypothetical protein
MTATKKNANAAPPSASKNLPSAAINFMFDGSAVVGDSL